MAASKRYRVTMQGKDKKNVYVHVLATSEEDAVHQAERMQFRREERFPLTFDRLEQAKATGKPGLLGVDPKLGGAALTEAWVAAEMEKRKRDQDRYSIKVVKTEAMP